MVAAFVAMSAIPILRQTFPPVLGALIAGVVVIVLTGNTGLSQPLTISIVRPNLYVPTLSMRALLELVIPLAVTVIGIHNAQGFAILKSVGYESPVNTLTVACGVGSLLFGIVGSVSTCVTGPVSAILNSSGDKDRRFIGGIIPNFARVFESPYHSCHCER